MHFPKGFLTSLVCSLVWTSVLNSQDSPQSSPGTSVVAARPALLADPAGGLPDPGPQPPRARLPLVQAAYLKASNPDASDCFGGAVALSGNTLVVSAPGESSGATGVDGDSMDNGSGDAGAVYVFVLQNNVWTQEAYLKASNTDAFDFFGASVAISGDTIVVGASREDSTATGVGGDQSDNSASEAGAAYVFERTSGSWAQTAYLKASNAQADNRFGTSVAISGNLIAVGAPNESGESTGINGSQAQGPGFHSGAVYLFRKSAGVWAQEAYVKASNAEVFDTFGERLALFDSRLVVGARNEDSRGAGVDGDQSDNSGVSAGAAYVFFRRFGSWTQEAYLKAASPDAGDNFGFSVDIWDETIAVGAWAEGSSSVGVGGNGSDNQRPNSGVVFIFVLNNGTWQQEAYLKASNPKKDAFFGNDVAVFGDRVVVGAEFEDSGSTGINPAPVSGQARGSGAAYSFVRNGSTWSQEAFVKASNAEDNDFFGLRLALEGGLLVSTATGEDGGVPGVDGDAADNSQSRSGAAYVLDLSNPGPQSVRYAGSNPASYSAPDIMIGQTWTPSVDLGATTGHANAILLGYSSPLTYELGGLQVLLVNALDPAAFVFQLPAMPGPVATWSVAIPNDMSLVGLTVYTQAVHVGAAGPFALSNALDLLIGL